MTNFVKPHSFFSDFDIKLFRSGKHFKLYEKMGAHLCTVDGEEGCYFSVWAPTAHKVAVIGNFNFWSGDQHMLYVRWDSSGIWEGFIPGLKKGENYKFKIWSNNHGQILEKADPYARFSEHPPQTASIIWDDNHDWDDEKWLKNREKHNSLQSPFAIYEIHLASWKKNIEKNRSLTYDEMAKDLVSYVQEMGYTHVELMPIMEHPYDPSWGYQVTSYFAPTSRFGAPEGFAHLVNAFHNAEIGVILDWVPAHFPSDSFALANFDGTNLYEHPDPRKGYHPDWKSLIFNFERPEVRSFLISSALYWLDRYHIDGLRVDAVASILYLDYSRNYGEWEQNEYGGNENLAAISFIKDFNAAVYHHFPGVQTIAEESTAFSMVSRPVDAGGLGFGMKWMMGWMNDTLAYFSRDTIYRKYHQGNLSFSLAYAFSENYVLPLSHDEVVHGKASLLSKMPGDEWQKFANLRLLYGYMYTHPGAVLLFMGADIAQGREWNFATSLDWHLLGYKPHKGINDLVKDLNAFYKKQRALTDKAFEYEGFEWIDFQDAENSTLIYMRHGNNKRDDLLVICNFTPNSIPEYKVGLPGRGKWKLLFNTDDPKYWGSGYNVKEELSAKKETWHGRDYSSVASVAPLAVLIYGKP